MRLTDQLTAELATIETRVDYLNDEVLLPIGMDHGWKILLCDVTIVFSCYAWYITEKNTNKYIYVCMYSFIPGMEYMKLGGLRQLSADYGEEYEDIIQELSIYKEKMENILCKTDIKEQDHLPMDRSLWFRSYES